MNQLLGIALIAAAVALAVYGIRASDSLASDFSRFFTGSPTEKTVWLILAAIGCTITGVILLSRKASPVG